MLAKEVSIITDDRRTVVLTGVVGYIHLGRQTEVSLLIHCLPPMSKLGDFSVPLYLRNLLMGSESERSESPI